MFTIYFINYSGQRTLVSNSAFTKYQTYETGLQEFLLSGFKWLRFGQESQDQYNSQEKDEAGVHKEKCDTSHVFLA